MGRRGLLAHDSLCLGRDATHEQVAGDKELFMHTLRQFHSDMGIPLVRPPHMAGKEVDLHLLYFAVTNRGGLEKVRLP